MMPQQIQKTFFKVSDFISWQKAGNLLLSPKFQRRAVWKPGAKSFLIDTIVRGLPIPIIFLRDRRTDPDKFEPVREIVDGQQRIRTVLSYVSPALLKDFDKEKDAFTVYKTHNLELAGKSFSDLDEETRQSILDYEFIVHVLPARVDDRQVIEIFRRINSTNYSLNKQELRNAKFYGEFKTSVYKLAEEQLQRWRKWRTFTEDKISRMAEVELTAECALMMINEKIGGKTAAKIDKAFEDYDETYPFRENIENRFRAVMDTIDKYFGDEPDFVFLRTKVIYTFFTFVYELICGLETPLDKFIKPKLLTTADIAGIKQAGHRIKTRVAKAEVLNATDRRTTNPKERKILFDYLQNSVKNA